MELRGECRGPHVDLLVPDDLARGGDHRRVELAAAARGEVEQGFGVGELGRARSRQLAPGAGDGEDATEARCVGAGEPRGPAVTVPALAGVENDEGRLQD